MTPAPQDRTPATSSRRRLAALAALAVIIAAGLVVSRGLPSSVGTDIAGDALYAAAAYTGLVVILPRARRWAVALAAVGWCTAVELLQLTGLPIALAERMPPVALILGTGFDARDLVVYTLAVATAAAIDAGASARLLPGGRRPADVGRSG